MEPPRGAPAAAPERTPIADLVPIADLDRARLAASVVGYIKRGAWNKADVMLALVREGRFAVKDYRAKTWFVRLAGRAQLRREERAYRCLEGLRGVPRLGRRIDADAVAVEYVEGVRLPKFHKQRPLPHLAAHLAALLEAIHARGVVHNDIRSRDNILVTPAGRLFLIDFSSAMRFRSAWSRRMLMPIFEGAERRAVLKWKAAIAPETMTAAEREAHRRFTRLRRLWPFNPKEDLEVKRARRGEDGES
jgi:RIO-like serine/threonine protein kinase